MCTRLDVAYLGSMFGLLIVPHWCFHVTELHRHVAICVAVSQLSWQRQQLVLTEPRENLSHTTYASYPIHISKAGIKDLS